MSRLLLVGTGPLLEAGSTVMSGQCLRTWHFTAPLRAAGHTLLLATVPIPGATSDVPPPVVPAEYEGLAYHRLQVNDAERSVAVLRALAADFRPDAIVGINAWPAFLAASLGLDLPLWADLNGWTLAEGIVRGAVVGHDDDYPHFWRTEALVALSADAFSTVTRRQAWALEGELAVLGRLSRETADREYISVVDNAVHPEYARLRWQPGVPAFLADRIPPEAQIVLWSGGFNSWTDLELLVGALERAMARAPHLHFVSTGAGVLGHDEATYARFLELAGARLPAGRWHALGWVALDQVLALHAAARVGINIDGANMETRFGARNRLTNMLGAGLPVITTEGTEVAEWIARGGHGVVLRRGDVEAYAGAMVAAVAEPERHAARAAVAREAALHDFAAANTLGRFLEWAAKPVRMPAGGDGVRRLRDWVRSQAANPLPFAPPPPESLCRRILRRARRLLG
jgi:glycosyltransferase involved in cell wall biosynthesis